MPRKSIVPDIRLKLEPWLEEKLAAWQEMSAGGGRPTLPHHDDGKINVRAVALAIGLEQAQEQHFYKHVELRTLLNAAAEAQGLKTVGSRLADEATDEALVVRAEQARREADNYARTLAEREAVIEAQRRRIASLEEQLALRDETGMAFRLDTATWKS